MIKNRELSSAPYGTHLTPLVAAVLKTKGNVVELGMGDYSTPILHEICKYEGRFLVSFEHNKEWLSNFLDLENNQHIIEYVKNWDEIRINECGVLFVDHGPAERRIIEIERFKNLADIIVVHDTDKMKYYGYETVFSKFKYRYKYERYRKSTTLLSNIIDVSKIFD